MQIAYGEWPTACAALLGNCLGKCYSGQAKIILGSIYSKSTDFQPVFSLFVKYNLCSMSSNKRPCHGQTIYSSFRRKQEELAAPQLLQASVGQIHPCMSCEVSRRPELSEEIHETWALTSLTGIEKHCTNAQQHSYFIRIFPEKHGMVSEGVWKQNWALFDPLV